MPARQMFKVIAVRARGVLLGYEIHAHVGTKLNPFLRCVSTEPRLKRHEAYAIMKLLNAEKRARKWAVKFSDPYTRKRMEAA